MQQGFETIEQQRNAVGKRRSPRFFCLQFDYNCISYELGLGRKTFYFIGAP